MNTKKVILFGAGDGGYRTFLSLRQEYEVIAFVDNNVQKHGSTLLSKPVISPVQIKNYAYDYVIIANIHGHQVRKQLIEELGILEAHIIDHYHNDMLDSRVATLRQVADEIYSNNLQGSVAELGVFQGEFAKYISESFCDRDFYLFDTFEGFDERDIQNEHRNKFSDARVGEFKNTSIEAVLNKMTSRKRCFVKKGYFPQTTEGMDENFVFVSIDVDLYSPILEGLRYFYPRMQEGGYIFVHDYNSLRFSGVKSAIKDFSKEFKIKYVPISDMCGSAVIIK
ncbi:TylF/MycF/NovP-related O-methyltransferase [Paenibacillus vandeheii]